MYQAIQKHKTHKMESKTYKTRENTKRIRRNIKRIIRIKSVKYIKQITIGQHSIQ